MKFIVRLSRLIIIFILGLSIGIVILDTMQTKAKTNYINIEEYAFYEVKDDYLLPNIEQGTVLILKQDKEYTATVGDYVYLYEDGIKRVKIITEDDGDRYKVAYTNMDESETMVKKNSVLAKVYYQSETITIIYQILTNWIVILALVVYLVLSPTIIYKRYDE